MSPLLRTDRKFASLQGSTIAYIDVGHGDVVVLGHSYLWDAEMWAPQIAALSRHYRVIVPELWGHGQSGPLPVETVGVQQIAIHHLALLNVLGIREFALVGQSVGGMWAVELALIAPERVTALCLIGTDAGAEPTASRELYYTLLDTVAALGAVPAAVSERLVPMIFSPSTMANRPDLVEGFRRSLIGIDRRNLLDTLVPLGRMIFSRRDALPDLQRISAPSLVISGEHDPSRSS